MSMETTNLLESPTAARPSSGKVSVLFVCQRNTCRSQMAEAFTKALFPGQFIAYSAGVEGGDEAADPLAVAVMREAGIDMSHARSKPVDAFSDSALDYVVMLQSGSDGSPSPAFKRKVKTMQHSFDNPAELTRDLQSEDEKLAVYRKVRDEIKSWVQKLPTDLVFSL